MVIQIEIKKIGCDSVPMLGMLALDFFSKSYLMGYYLMKQTNRPTV